VEIAACRNTPIFYSWAKPVINIAVTVLAISILSQLATASDIQVGDALQQQKDYNHCTLRCATAGLLCMGAQAASTSSCENGSLQIFDDCMKGCELIAPTYI
jgi:hypothetical protein